MAERNKFVLKAERRIGNCRDPDHITFDGGNDRLDMFVRFDKYHPGLSVNITMLANEKTGLAELWVFDRKVWTESFPDHS